MLTAHAYICRVISSTTKEEGPKTILEKYSLPKEDYKQFHWYSKEQADILYNKGANTYLNNLGKRGNLEELMPDITRENFEIAKKYLCYALTDPFRIY